MAISIGILAVTSHSSHFVFQVATGAIAHGMIRIIVMSSISTHISTPVKQFASVGRGRTLLNALQHLQRQPQAALVLEFLGLFALIAGLDHVIDRDLSFFALYL